jgi:hypothetical protein
MKPNTKIRPADTAIIPPEIGYVHTGDTDCVCGPVFLENGALLHRQMTSREDLIAKSGPDAVMSEEWASLFKQH